MMKPIAICGAGGLGREVLMLIRQINSRGNDWLPVGFFDDNCPKGTVVHGVPVLGTLDDLRRYPEPLNVVLAVGSPFVKQSMAIRLADSVHSFATLIHPDVELQAEQRVFIGEGTIITAGNILTCDIIIGSHVLINLKCTIGHDANIGSFASMMPGCHISGNVTVGEGAYLGTGAVLINGITIRPGAIIGAGAVVVHEVESHTTVVGVPARPLHKENKL